MSAAWQRRALEAAISGIPWTLPSNGDVPCPNDGELVNKRCWKCGWVRQSTDQTYADAEHKWQPAITINPYSTESYE